MFEQLADFRDLGRRGVDDQLVAVGVGAAVVAQQRLHQRQHIIGRAVIQRDDFGGCTEGQGDAEQQAREQGTRTHSRKLLRSGAVMLVCQA
ncbi:hypothetical protein D3C84_870410 [compost metagenome]